LNIDFPFQLFYLLAERRLRNMDALGGASEMQFFSDR
jgi:hypothetical protein